MYRADEREDAGGVRGFGLWFWKIREEMDTVYEVFEVRILFIIVVFIVFSVV